MASNGTTNGTHLDFTNFYNVIDGKLESTAKTHCSVNPSTLENNPNVPVSTSGDVDRAVAAAEVASEKWADVPLEERRKALIAMGHALEENINGFAKMMVKEQGKPLAFAVAEIQASVNYFHTFAGIDIPEKVHNNKDGTQITRFTPIGVAVGIVPWNFPVQLTVGKICPALVTGNALILKPSPFTPYCCLKLVEMGQKFFPPGVLQVLSGDDSLGPMLTVHPGVGKVSFTGSTATGKKIMESCAKSLKRVTLELGGNDPAIVCPDADPAVVGPKIALMTIYNSGQICVAIKRVYIHESIYEAVLESMVNFLKQAKVSDGFEDGAFVGPLCNRMQFDKVQNLLRDIEATKLTIAHGNVAQSDGKKGLFITPTIIDNPPEDSRIVVEEPFAPVFPALKWSDEADVISRANNTDYGLGASVWTNDDATADRLSRKLKAGTVWINMHGEIDPAIIFSGHKQSGIGVEFGAEGMLAYCNAQSVIRRNL